jgi:DNA polymerase-3 subunit epsilon
VDDQLDLDACATALENTGVFRVLRKIAVPSPELGPIKPNERVALALDTETTGLDPALDDVIEVGAVAFTYTDDGRIGSVIGLFEGLREPTVPITEEITTITGISPDMVRGKSLDLQALQQLIESSDVIIAHNAGFDRPFCERISPLFATKHWACSATEVPWRNLGFEGNKLAYLLYQCGFFHDGHRALDDAVALMHVLAGHHSQDRTPLALLLESARKPTMRIEIEAPYELRMELRKRGYRWKPRSELRGGIWRIEVDFERAAQEFAFAESRKIPSNVIRVTKMTALNRFRD